MRDRRAEQREDTVAGRLHDIAVVPVNGIDHELQRRIDNCACLFGVEVLLKFSRSLDVREQRGDRLALALERACIRPLGRYADAAVGSPGPTCPSYFRSRLERSSTWPQKSNPGGFSKPRNSGRSRRASYCIPAELHACWVLGLALRATHLRLPSRERMAEYRDGAGEFIDAKPGRCECARKSGS